MKGIGETYQHITINEEAPPVEEFPYRVAYSDVVPTPGYLFYPAVDFEAAKAQALALAARDLEPGSGVEVNLIFVQRWDAEEQDWSGYDADGEDLDDIVFNYDEDEEVS